MASLPHGTSHSKHPSGPTCAVAVDQTVRWAEDSSSPTSCRKTSLSSPMTREKVRGGKMNLYYLAADDNKHCCLLRCYVLKQEHDVFPFCIIFCLWHLTTFLFHPHSSFNSHPLWLWFTVCLCLHVFSQARPGFPLRLGRISQSSQ